MSIGCFGVKQQSSEEVKLPLVSLGINAEVVDVYQKLQLEQRFINSEKESPLEVTYRFDAGKWAANGFLGEFSASVDDRVFKGIIKDKEEAQDDYDDAIAEGKSAAVVHKKKDGSFQASLGNLPPQKECTVIISFFTHVQVDPEERLTVTIPTCLFPKLALKEGFEGCTVTVSVKLSGGLQSLECEDFPIKVERQEDNNCKVTAKLPALPTTDFVLKVSSKEAVQSRGWLQKDDEGKVVAASVVVQPIQLFKDFFKDEPPKQVIFVLDCSGSMSSHGRIQQSADAMSVFLRSLPMGIYFSLIKFGTRIETFPSNQDSRAKYDEKTLVDASKFIEAMKSNLGCTDMTTPLKRAYTLCDSFSKEFPNGTTDIFVLTDGFVDDPQGTLALVKQKREKARLFSVGLGNDCSYYQVRSLASLGGGLAEFAGDGDEALTLKVQRLLKQTRLASLRDVTATWVCPNMELAYKPETTTYPVFMGNAIVQSLLLHQVPQDELTKQPIKCTITCRGPAPNFEPLKATIECTNITTEPIMSRLAANSIIETYLHHMSPHSSDKRQWPDQDALKTKAKELGIKYSIATPWTSFVCVLDTDTSQQVVGAMKQVEMALTEAHAHELKRKKNSRVAVPQSAAVHAQQQQPTALRRQQDDDLDMLASRLQSLKCSSSTISDELQTQGQMLDQIECSVDGKKGKKKSSGFFSGMFARKAPAPAAKSKRMEKSDSRRSSSTKACSSQVEEEEGQMGGRLRMKVCSSEEEEVDALLESIADDCSLECAMAPASPPACPPPPPSAPARAPPPPPAASAQAPPPPPPPATTTAAKPVVQPPSVVAIAKQQTALGSWGANSLSSLVGWCVNVEQVNKAIPAACNGKADVWATAVVVALLEVKMVDDQEEWELLVEKAREWLKGNCGDAQAVLQAARALF